MEVVHKTSFKIFFPSYLFIMKQNLFQRENKTFLVQNEICFSMKQNMFLCKILEKCKFLIYVSTRNESCNYIKRLIYYLFYHRTVNVYTQI